MGKPSHIFKKMAFVGNKWLVLGFYCWIQDVEEYVIFFFFFVYVILIDDL